MSRIVHGARALAKHWGPLIAESVGLREPEPTLKASGRPPSRDEWESSEFGAFWFGQATALLRVGGQTILTDPHFGEHAGMPIAGRNVGRRRSTSIPGSVEELPPVDVVLLSHAHMDHWEKTSLERLAGSGVTAIIPRKTRRLLPARGRHFGAVIELDWDQGETLDGLAINALRCKHWGARYLIDVHRGYNAYVLEDDRRRLVFAADTAETDAFDTLSDIDVAVMGIGNYYVPWDLMHSTPEQAAAMAQRMGARRMMPIHHSTFRDPCEPIGEPLERLLRVWDPQRIICARIGEAHLE
jgi:L-ascorbate metabolism protein UlaG (beta-lactamase superfamily)